MKRVPIFKPGRHTSAGGTTLDFSEEQLAASIAAYDPAKHEAPLVIGHPKDNGPAFGWVTGLSFAEGEVVADVGQVNADFAEMVTGGAFKKRSASWYTPDSPSNPVPGVYYLRHVGFLGAQPPAIKGLSPVQFNEAEEGVVEFSDSALVTGLLARLVRGMRDAWLAKFGQEDADRALPSWVIEDLEREAARQRETEATANPLFHEANTMTLTPEQIAQLQADHEAAQARLAALEGSAASFAEREARVAAAERTALVGTIAASLQPHVDAGRLLPALVAPMADFMAGLDDATQVVEFGEAVEGVTPKLSQRAFLAQFLAGLPKAVDFTERAGGTGPTGTELTAQALASQAQAYVDEQASKGRHVSYVEAVDHVVATQGAAE